MKAKIELNDLSHHAYYLIGNESVRDDILKVLEKNHSVVAQGNPDFFNRKYTSFTIDDARELKLFHETRPIHASGKKIFILVVSAITVEAQNALLKLLEEPSDYAHFFLIVPSAHLLLPTVKSRMSLLSFDGKTGKVASDLTKARDFLKLSKAKRLDYIKKLLDEVTKEKKTKQDAIEFLNDVEAAIYEDKGVKEGFKSLEAIQIARKYVNDRAPSMKMLLEYVALNV